MPANLTRPCIRGCGGQCPGERNPASGQCSECGDAAVREHLPLRALASALGEQASRNQKGEEQHESPPSESPDRRQANRERSSIRSYDYLTTVDSPFRGAAMTVDGRHSGQFLAGDPEMLIEEIVAQQKATAAGVLVIRNELGSVDVDQALAGIELFAREVLPVVHQL